MRAESEIETLVAEALRGQRPVRGLPGVSIEDVQERPEQPFDISFDLVSGPNRIPVLGEIKRRKANGARTTDCVAVARDR